MAPRLQLRDIDLTLGVTPLLSGAELSISPGERIALVGRNGSGKSTLLRIAAGEIAPDSGERFVQPGLAMAYLASARFFRLRQRARLCRGGPRGDGDLSRARFARRGRP